MNTCGRGKAACALTDTYSAESPKQNTPHIEHDDDDAEDEHDQEHNCEITREDISVELPEHAHGERREERLAYRTEGLAKSERKVRPLTRACARTKARTFSPCSS